ncbi:MAG: tetratricopeptide repeat protein [Solidesulfovibrio sp.]
MSRFPLVFLTIPLLVLALAGCQKQTPLPPAAPTPTVSERLEVGKKAFAAGNCAAAVPALREAAGFTPEPAEAHLYLGLCAARQNEPDRAELELRRAAALDSKDPRPLEALGILLYALDRRDAAKASLAEAVARGSANAQVAYYQGNLAMFAGDCPAAMLAYRRAMILDASFAPAVAEYQSARVACAKAEQASAPKPAPSPPPVKPKPKIAAKTAAGGEGMLPPAAGGDHPPRTP